MSQDDEFSISEMRRKRERLHAAAQGGYVNLILNTFSATVAANEGVRAGGGDVGVGVSVPVGR